MGKWDQTPFIRNKWGLTPFIPDPGFSQNFIVALTPKLRGLAGHTRVLVMP